MRILCEMGPYGSACEGWGRVFRAAGHEFTLWHPGAKPAFDAFDECDPHLFISGREPTRAVRKCLAEKGARVVDRRQPESAADTFLFDGGIGTMSLACDFAYIGAYRPDKEALLNAHILPMAGHGTLKIFGTGPWPTPYYLGPITDETARAVYASATVTLNVSASGRTGDRVYNSILAGGVCVTNELVDSPVRGDVVVRGLDPGEFHDFAAHVASDKATTWRRIVRDQGRELVLAGHTYWHRGEAILRAAGFAREADQLMETYRATVRV